MGYKAVREIQDETGLSLYIWRNNNSNGMGGFNVLDNIVAFYIFFTVVGFLAAMLGTIIGAGGGLVFVPLFMYWFPEWSPSMVVGTSLFSVMCNAISGSIAYLKQKKVYINAAIIFSLATFPGGYFRCPNVWMVLW